MKIILPLSIAAVLMTTAAHAQRRLYEGNGLHLRRWRAEEEVSLPTIALVYLDVGRPEHSCTAKQTYAPRKTAGLFADNGERKFLARSCR